MYIINLERTQLISLFTTRLGLTLSDSNFLKYSSFFPYIKIVTQSLHKQAEIRVCVCATK